MFLSSLKTIENPKAIFFALIFNHMISEYNNTEYSLRSNLDSFDYFVSQTRSYDLISIKRAVKLLISEDEFIVNDLISEKDFKLFKDILLYYRPIEILPEVFGILYETEQGFSFKFRTNHSKEELKVLVIPILDLMMQNSTLFNNKNLKLAYTEKVNSLLLKYNKTFGKK